jgi:hypothetical protein
MPIYLDSKTVLIYCPHPVYDFTLSYVMCVHSTISNVAFSYMYVVFCRLFLVIFIFKGTLCVYGEYAKQQKQPENFGPKPKKLEIIVLYRR